MQASRLVAASGTLVLMALISGAVARDIARPDRPYQAEPLAPAPAAISVDVRSSAPASYSDVANANDDSDDDSTVP